MMRTLKMVLATVGTAALLAAAGCSGSPDPDDPTSPGADTATAVGATVRQWASEVAGIKEMVDESDQDWNDRTCSSIAVSEGDALCGATIIPMKYNAQTANITLGGLVEAGGRNSLGEPPAEIASLVDETVQAAAAAAMSGEAMECPGDDCLGGASAFTRDWGDLVNVLAKWEPYL